MNSAELWLVLSCIQHTASNAAPQRRHHNEWKEFILYTNTICILYMQTKMSIIIVYIYIYISRVFWTRYIEIHIFQPTWSEGLRLHLIRQFLSLFGWPSLRIYRLKDSNGDGKIDPDEVDSFVARKVGNLLPWEYLVAHPTNRKWVITPVINGISRVSPLITGVITHLLSGMSHQVPTWMSR